MNPARPTSPNTSGARTRPEDHENWTPPHVKAMATALEAATTRKLPLFSENVSDFERAGVQCRYLHPIHTGKLFTNGAFGCLEFKKEEYQHS